MADLIAPLPIIRLYGGMTIRLEAIDPSSGAPVAGVAVSDVAIYGQGIDSGGSDAPLFQTFLTPQDA